jgi:hypothetical protein
MLHNNIVVDSTLFLADGHFLDEGEEMYYDSVWYDPLSRSGRY